MAIRFYMNGTEGATDGTEISNGDLTNPLVVDGFYPAAGVTVEKTVTVMVRADAGETWKCVVVAVTSTDTSEVNKFMVTANNRIGLEGNGGMMNSFPFFPEVSDVNQPLTLKVEASGDETNSPDTTQKLQIIGGVKV